MFTKVWMMGLLLLPGCLLNAQEALSAAEQADLRLISWSNISICRKDQNGTWLLSPAGSAGRAFYMRL